MLPACPVSSSGIENRLVSPPFNPRIPEFIPGPLCVRCVPHKEYNLRRPPRIHSLDPPGGSKREGSELLVHLGSL